MGSQKRVRMPRQERSRVTTDAIVEATARILETEGVSALRTRRIARDAGVGIGSVYEYFESKGAIVREILERRASEVRAFIDLTFDSLEQAPIEQAVQVFVDGMYALNVGRLELNRVLLRDTVTNEYYRAMDEHLQARLVKWLELRSPELSVEDPEATAFALVRAGRYVTMQSMVELGDEAMMKRIQLVLKRLFIRTLLGERTGDL